MGVIVPRMAKRRGVWIHLLTRFAGDVAALGRSLPDTGDALPRSLPVSRHFPIDSSRLAGE